MSAGTKSEECLPVPLSSNLVHLKKAGVFRRVSGCCDYLCHHCSKARKKSCEWPEYHCKLCVGKAVHISLMLHKAACWLKVTIRQVMAGTDLRVSIVWYLKKEYLQNAGRLLFSFLKFIMKQCSLFKCSESTVQQADKAHHYPLVTSAEPCSAGADNKLQSHLSVTLCVSHRKSHDSFSPPLALCLPVWIRW